MVILYPLWLGSMPAMLKALIEQMLRPAFAFSATKLGHWPRKLLRGSTAEGVLERLPCDALIVKSADFAAMLPF